MATAEYADSRCCAQCGLPVASGPATPTLPRFCCHACRLVSRIVGPGGDGEHAWGLLRLGIGSLLAMNIMMISLLLYAGSIEPDAIPLFRSLLLMMSLAAMLVLIPPFLAAALRECREQKYGLDVLIAGGSIAAFGVSAANTVRGTGPVYFDTATMLPVLVTFGKMLEGSAKRRAGELLHTLETLLPVTARKLTAEGEIDVTIDHLRPGDLIRVRPGERIPADGVITEGHTLIAEAAFTGEHLPRDAAPGDSVTAGTVNGLGTVVVRAVRTGEDLLLNRIVAMIKAAWRNRSRAERLAEKAAVIFVPIVFAAALILFTAWSWAGNPVKGMLNALSLLVVACPCSMGIATPLATSLAIARTAMAGIVVRGGAVMEGIAGIDAVFFDKTGTVTDRTPFLQRMTVHDQDTSEDELLGRLAALESASEHPLAEAVVAAARRRGLEPGRVTDVRVLPGEGISGEVTWRGKTERVTAGSGTAGKTAVAVAWGGKNRGTFFFRERVRPGAREAVVKLHELGVATALLSGDRWAAAAAIAREVGIGRIEAPRTPEEKLSTLRAEIGKGRIVAMVGDGINDAPALAAASCGIAVGGGTALARQAGQVIILSDRLDRLPWLIRLGRRTDRIIRWNLAWSFGYNAIALAAAAAGLLHPLIAAVAMVVSSLTVLGNSLRITAFPDDAGTIREER